MTAIKASKDAKAMMHLLDQRTSTSLISFKICCRSTSVFSGSHLRPVIAGSGSFNGINSTSAPTIQNSGKTAVIIARLAPVTIGGEGRVGKGGDENDILTEAVFEEVL